MNPNFQPLTNNMDKDQAISDLLHYQIKIKGQVDSQWRDWFDDLAITPDEDGNTVLRGPLTDQAALHGLLKKINNLGLTLISVNPQSQSE